MAAAAGITGAAHRDGRVGGPELMPSAQSHIPLQRPPSSPLPSSWESFHKENQLQYKAEGMKSLVEACGGAEGRGPESA